MTIDGEAARGPILFTLLDKATGAALREGVFLTPEAVCSAMTRLFVDFVPEAFIASWAKYRKIRFLTPGTVALIREVPVYIEAGDDTRPFGPYVASDIMLHHDNGWPAPVDCTIGPSAEVEPLTAEQEVLAAIPASAMPKC